MPIKCQIPKVSRKKITPIMAMPTMPSPDQIAYTIPTGRVFNVMDINQKAQQYPIATMMEGISFVYPSDNFRKLVAITSDTIAKNNNR